MNKCVFTICAKNYIGLAQVLENSIKTYNKDVDFYIFVADEFSSDEDIKSLPNNVLVAKEILGINPDQWNQLSFKYDLTEFCTCLKPFCFKYIFSSYKPEGCIYLDPDILVFNSLDYVFEKLEQYSIILTPHITTMQDIYTGKLNEQNLLYSGMYNLGFLALKTGEVSSKMLDWWEIRLEDRCYRNRMESYFTDQKWMDFLPAFFPSQLLISFHLGLNLAPWNFHEREVIINNNAFFVKNRILKDNATIYPLIFMHFSGFNYDLLLNDEISHGNINDIEIHADLNSVIQEYSKQIKTSNFSKYINLSYSYNFFSNQVHISQVYRRLYRRLLDDGKIKSNPFNASEHFYLALSKGKLIKKGMLNCDRSSVSNTSNSEQKTIFINRLFNLFYKLIGAERFFQLVKLMRLYSKFENHVYLIDKSYFESFKIRN